MISLKSNSLLDYSNQPNKNNFILKTNFSYEIEFYYNKRVADTILTINNYIPNKLDEKIIVNSSSYDYNSYVSEFNRMVFNISLCHDFTQITVAYCLLNMMLSMAINGNFKIEVSPSWHESIALYTLMLGAPGEKKCKRSRVRGFSWLILDASPIQRQFGAENQRFLPES
jgi:hypothetical protein